MSELKQTITDLVVNDYFTPNIKAEVMLDTLLTPYIEGILQEYLGIDAKLIAKEMSVCETTNTLRADKPDGAVDKNDIYLGGKLIGIDCGIGNLGCICLDSFGCFYA